jgi:SAM-dependent methyltransferase
MEMWKVKEFNSSANVEWWDSMASQFGGCDVPQVEDNFTMGIISKEKMINPGAIALDIGCGAGRYSFAICDMGATITGIDVSPKMIDTACKKTNGRENIAFYNEDWHNLDIDAKGWRGSFDFVLANMTPAIIDSVSFVKMSEASRDWCLMVKPINRNNSLYDELNELVGAPNDKAVTDETVEYAFSILWSRGYRPFLAYERQEWYNKKPLDQAIEQYTKRVSTFHTLDDAQRELIRDFITSQAVDGEIEEITNTEIVALYWQVKR